jgi:hypothetical protein
VPQYLVKFKGGHTYQTTAANGEEAKQKARRYRKSFGIGAAQAFPITSVVKDTPENRRADLEQKG